MRSLSWFIILGFAFFISACSSVKVTSDYDPEYDFTKMKNYRWASSKELNPADILTQHPLVYKRIEEAVDGVLKAKGYNLVEDDNFDFVVLAHAGSKEKMNVHFTTTAGYYRGWYDPWWGPYGNQTTVSYYEEATLVLDIVSWANKELAWRGTATATVDQNPTPESMQKKIDDAVTKLFANFPPGSVQE